ncbi:MAG: restriction endonuclease [Bacteroidales bacterium]|nr:restriction endonuclease [Bacteroidales bacterium]
MNSNTEYELFTREIYQQLVNSDVVRATKVQHDIKLEGRSGQKHQIDVYWEYEIAGSKHQVAIECKNYSKPVSKEKVCAFKGVLDDLNGVNGIMVTKVGYQKGAKEYAKEYGISLKELREPRNGETTIGEIELLFHFEVRHTLFKVDENWASEHNIDIAGYKQRLDMISLVNDHKWSKATHIPLQTTDSIIRDAENREIISLDLLQKQIPVHPTDDFPYVFRYDDAYINTSYWVPVKILEVKIENQRNIISIDAEGFVKAILKDALNNKTDFMVMR